MYKQIISLLLLATVINAQLIGWRDCGSDQATINRVRVGNCIQTPCTFVRGQTYIIEIDATANGNSTRLPYEMRTISPFQIPLRTGDACDSLVVGQCPVVSGNHFTYRIDFPISPLLPLISAVVQSTLWDDTGAVGACLEVDAILTAG